MTTYQQQCLPVQMADGAGQARQYLVEAREYQMPHDITSVAIKALRLLNRMAKYALSAEASGDDEIKTDCKRSFGEIAAAIKAIMVLDGALDAIAIVARIEAADAAEVMVS